MIIIIAKKLIDGRWANIDANDMFTLGQVVVFYNEEWTVTNISGSKVTFEKGNLIL